MRPLVLSGPSTWVSAAGSREPAAAHLVIEDLARTNEWVSRGRQRVIAEFA